MASAFGAAQSAMHVGTRALPLLSKKGRRCSDNADVAALIRSFSLVDIGKLQEDWLLERWLHS